MHSVANDKQPTQYLRDDPCSKEAHVSEGVPVELCFDHLRACLLSSYWMGHICRT